MDRRVLMLDSQSALSITLKGTGFSSDLISAVTKVIADRWTRVRHGKRSLEKLI